MEPTSENLVKCLESLWHCHDVVPISITIDKLTYIGARYRQTLKYTSGMNCVTCGGKEAGETYGREAIYVLGDRPKHRRPNKTCYTMPGDDRDWYVAGYHHGKATNTTPAPELGANFLLMAWDAPNSTIDEYEKKPYDRIPIVINPA